MVGQARPHEDCSLAKQLRLELLDKRAWLGTHGINAPLGERCDVERTFSGKNDMQQLSQSCYEVKATHNKRVETIRVVDIVVIASACWQTDPKAVL